MKDGAGATERKAIHYAWLRVSITNENRRVRQLNDYAFMQDRLEAEQIWFV